MLAKAQKQRSHDPFEDGRRLRLLSYNIQTGTTTSTYREFLTQSWRHVLPHSQRIENLSGIAHMIRDYDVVGLQEVDAGSLRSGFINQTEYLAHRAHFPFWFHQTNRKFGKIAQPLRAALTGGSASPGIYEVLEVLGKERTLYRINRAMEHLQ